MSGIFWQIFAFGAIGIFLIVIIRRTLAISKLPAHLRWELAPIPHEKGKNRYGGSYLEEFEWWRKPQKHSLIAPIIYMAKEIVLLRGVWNHNRGLWPLSFAMHMGIYLIIVTLLLNILNAILITASVSVPVLNVFLTIASSFAIVGFLLGSIGAIGLILKRSLDGDLRRFNSFLKYFNLVFLGAFFVTGVYAWLVLPDLAAKMSFFIKDLVTLNSAMTVSFPLALNTIIALLFLIYLPLTDMTHFVAKYFAYHDVRWNDAPQDAKLTKELKGLLSQSVSWSAKHIAADGKKNWVDITTKKTNDE